MTLYRKECLLFFGFGTRFLCWPKWPLQRFHFFLFFFWLPSFLKCIGWVYSSVVLSHFFLFKVVEKQKRKVAKSASLTTSYWINSLSTSSAFSAKRHENEYHINRYILFHSKKFRKEKRKNKVMCKIVHVFNRRHATIWNDQWKETFQTGQKIFSENLFLKHHADRQVLRTREAL